MEFHKALDQISEIHAHLSKTEVFRGYRSFPVMLSGALALTAAALQDRFVASDSSEGYVLYWVVVGVLGAVAAGGGIVRNYLKDPSERSRRHTRTVLGQLIPSLAAGALVTGGLFRFDGVLIPFLPGLWAILFSLGIFASRPHLPRIIGYVALFYLLAGGVLLSMAGLGTTNSSWAMGLTFGVGQIMAGGVLYWDLERRNNG